MSAFKRGDRVRVDQPMVAGEPNPWHGKRGVVVREPGEEATPGAGPSSTYAVHFDDSPYPAAPFRDATMTDDYDLIVADE